MRKRVQARGDIVVPADPEVADLMEPFLGKRRRELPILRAALARGDYERLVESAHNMAGNGSGFGFEEISRIGADLEKAAAAADAAGAGALLERLEDYLRRVRVA